MLKLVVLVSGGGTNLQAIIDGIADGSIPNTEIKAVISNNKNAYALQRAKDHNIAAACVSPKDFADRAAFNQALLEKILSEEQIYVEKLFGYQEAGKIQLIREYGQLLSEEYTDSGIMVKARVPQEIHGKIM